MVTSSGDGPVCAGALGAVAALAVAAVSPAAETAATTRTQNDRRAASAVRARTEATQFPSGFIACPLLAPIRASRLTERQRYVVAMSAGKFRQTPRYRPVTRCCTQGGLKAKTGGTRDPVRLICLTRTSGARSRVAGEAEQSFADDVELDVGGAAADRQGPGEQHRARPAGAV